MIKPINRIERKDVERFGFPGGNLDEYQRIATKSAIYPGQRTPFGLMYAALGLAEAGEVQNKVKKAFRDDGILLIQDAPLSISLPTVEFTPLTDERREQIIKELGGVLWYIAAVCNEIDARLSEVALTNLQELLGRTERGTLAGSGDNR